MHGVLHRREMSSALAMMGGPVPAGRMPDIAPTVLALLGLPAQGMDGVPLAEALGQAAPPLATRHFLAGHGATTRAMDEGRGRLFPAGTAF